MDNNIGYFFKNYFDDFCYFIITIFYPVISLYFTQLSSDEMNEVSLMPIALSGAFFCFTFFYDFYSRYRDCNNQKIYIIVLLFLARLFFFMVSIFSISSAIIIVLSLDQDSTKLFMMSIAFFKACPYFALIPFIFVVIDTIKRGYNDLKGKISKATV